MWSFWLVSVTVVFLLSALMRDLCKLPDGRGWLWEKLSLTLVGKAMLSKSLIQFSADGWGCVPSQSQPETPKHRQVYLSLLCGHCSFPLGPGAYKVVVFFFLLSPPRVSITPVLWKVCNQIPLTSKSVSLRILSPLSQTPRLGSLLWIPELS